MMAWHTRYVNLREFTGHVWAVDNCTAVQKGQSYGRRLTQQGR